MGQRAFTKMHGLGNDFVVLDGRVRPLDLTTAKARRVADRHTGIGCDQVITLESPRHGDADVFMRIHNADGGEVEACGNAARCVARLLLTGAPGQRVVIETGAGLVAATSAPGHLIAVDMGPARLDWHEIPLSEAMDTLRLPLAIGPLREPVAVSIGNPHAVFFVDDATAVALETYGPRLEHDPLFPERANVSVAHVAAPERLRLRVWERGVGVTRACGTGACAAAVAAHRRGLTPRRVEVELDGGVLAIEWRATDGHVVMTGPTTLSFNGEFDDELLD